MPLDTQTREFIAKSTSRPGPPPGSMSLPDFRAAVEAFRPLGFDREEVAIARELVLPGLEGGAGVSARLYVPRASSPPPLIVWAHGGSWVRVTVDLLDTYFRVAANRSGCAILAVDYRLAPESPFPAALEEVLAAGRWARSGGDGSGEWDSARIGIVGESSGGNIAAAVTLLDRERREVGFDHQALLVPVLDTRWGTASWRDLGSDYLLTRDQLEWAVEQYAPGVSRTEPLLSPACAESFADLPPALIVTGEYDPLRDEGRAYAEALVGAGVSVDYICRPGLIHHAVMVPKLIAGGATVLEETATKIGLALR